MKPAKRGLKERAIEETQKFLVMFTYLFVLLELFVLNESIVLSERPMELHRLGFAFINALILAKVMLLGEAMHLGAWLSKGRPLIYAIFGRAVLFATLLIGFHLAETAVTGLIKGTPSSETFPKIGGGSVKGTVFIGVIAAVSLIPFFTFTEISRALGKGVLRNLLLRRAAEG